MKLETLLLLHLRYFNYSSLGLGNPQFGTKSLQLCSPVKNGGFDNKRKQSWCWSQMTDLLPNRISLTDFSQPGEIMNGKGK